MQEENLETVQIQETTGVEQNPFARLLELHKAVSDETQGLRKAEEAARKAAKDAVDESKAKYNAASVAVKTAEEAVELPHRAVSITRNTLEDAERAGLADRVVEIQILLQQALPELKKLQLAVKVAREEQVVAAKALEAAEKQLALMQKPVIKQVQQPASSVPNPHTNLSLRQIIDRAAEIGAADEGWQLDGLRKSIQNLSLFGQRQEGLMAVNAAQSRINVALNNSRQSNVAAGIITLESMLTNTPCDLARRDLLAAKAAMEGEQPDWLTAERLMKRGQLFVRAAQSGSSFAAMAHVKANKKNKK